MSPGWIGSTRRMISVCVAVLPVISTASIKMTGPSSLSSWSGSCSVDGLVQNTYIASAPGAEADVLAATTWSGSPLRVYFGFFAVQDNYGDALAVIALYDDRRVELRVLRGGNMPLYGIFSLQETP